VLAGAIVIALLAVVFDLLLLVIQILLNRGRSAISVA
jgi:osmoprotectant transport system permease protein